MVRNEVDVSVVAEDADVRVHETHRDLGVTGLDEAFHEARRDLRAVGFRRVRLIARGAEAAHEEDDPPYLGAPSVRGCRGGAGGCSCRQTVRGGVSIGCHRRRGVELRPSSASISRFPDVVERPLRNAAARDAWINVLETFRKRWAAESDNDKNDSVVNIRVPYTSVSAETVQRLLNVSNTRPTL